MSASKGEVKRKAVRLIRMMRMIKIRIKNLNGIDEEGIEDVNKEKSVNKKKMQMKMPKKNQKEGKENVKEGTAKKERNLIMIKSISIGVAKRE